MINLKPQVLQALQNDAALISLLGGSRIYQLMAPQAAVFPRIVFSEFDNVPADYADDKEQDAEIHMQIDIYCQNQNTSAIALEVDKAMKSAGFFRTASTDAYDDDNDTQLYIKHMRYAIYIESEDL